MGGVTVFACSECGITLTRPVRPLEEAPSAPDELLGNSGDDWIPVGACLWDAGQAAGELLVAGGPILNVADMTNVRRHPERWFDYEPYGSFLSASETTDYLWRRERSSLRS